MALNVAGLFAEFRDHLHRLGVFDSVTSHEPKAAPGSGKRVAIWVQRVRPAVDGSGLDSTTAVLEFTIRLYGNMLAEPQDEIDPDMLVALDKVMAALIADFELGGKVRAVDVRGTYGVPLGAVAGYINQDNTLYRVLDATVPVIVNDLWPESA